MTANLKQLTSTKVSLVIEPDNPPDIKNKKNIQLNMVIKVNEEMKKRKKDILKVGR